MKKLFFAAALAIVAIGAANATTYYSATRSYDCTKTRIQCSTISEPIYSTPDLNPANQVVASTLVGVFYN
jgi:hypothetical protein